MIGLKFIKLSERWFIDIPYSGDVGDLEMVEGAATMLNCYDKGDGIVRITVLKSGEEPIEGREIASFRMSYYDDNGAVYVVNSNHYRDTIWLCNVTKLVLGDFPRYFEAMF